MKTAKQIKLEITAKRKTLKETKERFERYDNYEDMREIGILAAEIQILEWVVSEKS